MPSLKENSSMLIMLDMEPSFSYHSTITISTGIPYSSISSSDCPYVLLPEESLKP